MSAARGRANTRPSPLAPVLNAPVDCRQSVRRDRQTVHSGLGVGVPVDGEDSRPEHGGTPIRSRPAHERSRGRWDRGDRSESLVTRNRTAGVAPTVHRPLPVESCRAGSVHTAEPTSVSNCGSHYVWAGITDGPVELASRVRRAHWNPSSSEHLDKGQIDISGPLSSLGIIWHITWV